MMKIKQITIALVLVGVGMLAGWLLTPNKGHEHQQITNDDQAMAQATVWTCAMHPQIRMDKPGKCPLCAMDLIPLAGSNQTTAADPDVVTLSKAAIALADIQTAKVTRKHAVKHVSLYGTVQPDERKIFSVVAHVGGRIEKLYVRFEGEVVKKGQVIAQIYSPELLQAQKELLEADKMNQYALVVAAREKLKQWKMTDQQIDDVEKTGNVNPQVDLVANATGIVTNKFVEEGDYVSTGTALFNVADLSKIWIAFDAYEADLQYLHVGDQLEYSLQALPGTKHYGKIAYIDPTLNKTTRTASVRVDADNGKLLLKPEMYAQATVKINVGKGKANDDEGTLVVPKSAVLWTGKRSVVYVKQTNGDDAPSFKLREITLGTATNHEYVVENGLAEGEEVVAAGVFTVDAAAQLEGKLSMMNQQEQHTEQAVAEEVAPTIDRAIAKERASTNNQATAKDKVQDRATSQAIIKVQGSCDMCKTRIEAVAKGVTGVSDATWETTDQLLRLTFAPKKTSVHDIEKAIADAGHDTENHKATQVVYDQLPPCCKYRK